MIFGIKGSGLRVQAGLVLAGMLLAIAPPAEGPMLIVPIVPATLAATLGWALPAGAFPAAPGPFAGAVFVRGSRSTLLREAIAHGALLVTANFQTCSDNQSAPDEK